MSRLVTGTVLALAFSASFAGGTASAVTCTPRQVILTSACVAGDCAYGALGNLAWQTTTC